MGTNVANYQLCLGLKFNGVLCLCVAEHRSRFETTTATTSSPNKYDKSVKQGKLNKGGVRHHSKLSNAKMNNNASDDNPKPLSYLINSYHN
jgi:hypothetical protein